MSVKNKNLSSQADDNNFQKSESNSESNKISFKKYVALKTIKITADAVFQLVEGQEIPKEMSNALIESLVASNLIKQK